MSVVIAVTATSAYGVVTNVDDTTINDTTNGDGTSFTVRTDNANPAESTFLFSHNGKAPAEAWRMRIQATSDGLSFVKVGTGEVMRLTSNQNVGIGTALPQEKLDVNGNIRLTGNIVSPGDICIGSC